MDTTSDFELLHFIHTASFEASRRGVLDEEGLRRVERAIIRDPGGEGVERGTGGLRKIRVALPGRGKSGGARVMYLWIPEQGVVYLILAYAKNVKDSLSDAEKNSVRKLVERLKMED